MEDDLEHQLAILTWQVHARFDGMGQVLQLQNTMWYMRLAFPFEQDKLRLLYSVMGENSRRHVVIIMG